MASSAAVLEAKRAVGALCAFALLGLPFTQRSAAAEARPADPLSASAESRPGPADPVALGGLEFSVLTYNVHGLAPIPSLEDGGGPERRMPMIRRALDHFDLVLLQEDFEYSDVLSAGTPSERIMRGRQLPSFRWGYVPTAPLWFACWLTRRCGDPPLLGSGLSAVALGSEVTHLETLAKRSYAECRGYIGDGADCFATKGYTGTRVTMSNGSQIDVYNTHLEAGNAKRDLGVRTRQIVELANSVQQFSAGRAVVLAGDLNSNRDGGDRGDDYEPVSWLVDELGLVDAVTRAVGRKQMDYIFYRSGAGARLSLAPPMRAAISGEAPHCLQPGRSAGEAPCFVDPAGLALSDHPALYVNFLVEPAERSASSPNLSAAEPPTATRLR